jgi:hypothetical protein
LRPPYAQNCYREAARRKPVPPPPLPLLLLLLPLPLRRASSSAFVYTLDTVHMSDAIHYHAFANDKHAGMRAGNRTRCCQHHMTVRFDVWTFDATVCGLRDILVPTEDRYQRIRHLTRHLQPRTTTATWEICLRVVGCGRSGASRAGTSQKHEFSSNAVATDADISRFEHI